MFVHLRKVDGGRQMQIRRILCLIFFPPSHDVKERELNLNGESIHISSNCYKGCLAASNPCPNPCPSHRILIFDPELVQLLPNQFARLDFFKSKLRVLVDPPPYAPQPASHLGIPRYAQDLLRTRPGPVGDIARTVALNQGRRCKEQVRGCLVVLLGLQVPRAEASVEEGELALFRGQGLW